MRLHFLRHAVYFCQAEDQLDLIVKGMALLGVFVIFSIQIGYIRS